MATHVQDDGFHEIQLNGKQLVFLFMAATVVSVVIFLCGVLVGRGVKSERVTSSPDASTAAVIADAAPQPPPPTPAVPAGSDPTSATPPPAVDDSNLSYFNRLEKSNPTEDLKPLPAPPVERPAEAPARTAKATPPPVAPPKPIAAAPAAPKPAAPKEEAVSAAAAQPAAPASAGDYAIQVAALREAGEADTIAKRLVSKGYGAYVLTPPDGKPNVFRVRIGSFKTRREAEVIASKLQKEEQFKPWITR